MSSKADIQRINEILEVSISKKDLDQVNDNIETINQKIKQMEENLQSDSESNSGEEVDSYDDDYEDDAYEKQEEKDQVEIQEQKDNFETQEGRDHTEEDTLPTKQDEFKSKLSFKNIENSPNQKLYKNLHKANKGNKRSHNVLKNSVKFVKSDSSYNGEVRDSKVSGLSIQKSGENKINILGNNNVNSKLSFETPLGSKITSTSTLLNKLMFKSQKSKGKKVGRGEMDSVMQVIGDMLIKGNDNKMRLDTMEGNIELKIDTMIAQAREEFLNEVSILQEQVASESQKIHVRLDGFQRLNYRLNKKILDKPYAYADGIKEALEISQHELKIIFDKKYDQLLSRIVTLKRETHEGLDGGTITFGKMRITDDNLKKEIKADYEDSKLFMIQEELGAMRENTHAEFFKVSQKLGDFERVIDDFKDGLEEQMVDFKNNTSKDVNNTLKEFQAVDRELKRHQDLFREILGKYSNMVQEKYNHDKCIEKERNIKRKAHTKSPGLSLSDHKAAKANQRYKLSKSVIDHSISKPIKARVNEDSMQEEISQLNKSALPKISIKSKSNFGSYKSSPRLNLSTLNSRANYEINKTLQNVSLNKIYL